MMRAACFLTGAFVLAAAWLLPLEALLPGAFTAHMARHMAVVAIAAPLVALAIAGGRFDPARRFPSLGAAVGASLVELVIVWVWHAPLLHALARTSSAAFAAEQGTFFFGGLLVWSLAIGGNGDIPRAAAGLVALLLTSMHMTLLGALLALAPRPLYDHAAHAGGTLAALADQEVGGAIMLTVGGAAYLAGALALAARTVRQRSGTVTALRPQAARAAAEGSA
jgi:putative membrane protein